MPIMPKYVDVSINHLVNAKDLNDTIEKYDEYLTKIQSKLIKLEDTLPIPSVTTHTLTYDNDVKAIPKFQSNLFDMDTNSLLNLRRKIDEELSKRKIEQI